jgi:deoxyribodipyrimidine photo-lyase
MTRWTKMWVRELEKEGQEAYLEELIVRRERAMNFLYYTPNYDSYACRPQWAQKTDTLSNRE